MDTGLVPCPFGPTSINLILSITDLSVRLATHGADLTTVRISVKSKLLPESVHQRFQLRLVGSLCPTVPLAGVCRLSR